MTYVWATWLADALRADPVVAPRVVEVQGWKTRGRPPSEFSFAPSGLVEHHTGCFARIGHDPQSCLNGLLAGNSSVPAPIAQLLVTWTPLGTRWDGSNVDPRVIVVAAGRANHAGPGVYPWGAPSGNGSSIGIEACGPSSWPDAVIEFRERVTAALVRSRRHEWWDENRVTTHHEYARTGRKIDPSGAWNGQPALPLTAPWSAVAWRNRIAERLENDMSNATLWRHPAYWNVFLLGAGNTVNVSPAVYDSLIARNVPVIVEAHEQLLKTCLFQTGLTVNDLVPSA
jgi:hypothetical protein